MVEQRENTGNQNGHNGIDNIILTEEEAAIYDRQIRLWGVEAQQRLRKAKILHVGLTGLGNEVCKNILLAGIHHLTMLDNSILSKEDCHNQFLSPHEFVGKNKAEASLSRAKELNPMVDIVVDTEDVESKPESFFSKYDVVCMTGFNAEVQQKVNDICHRLGVKFLSGNVFGYYGYMFADLEEHTYMQEKVKIIHHKKGKIAKDEGPSAAKKPKTSEDLETEYEEKTSSFCTLSDALSHPLFEGKSLREAKQISKTYLVMKVLLEYYRRYTCFPNQAKSNQELQNLLDVRNDVFEKLQIDNELLPDEFTSYCVGTLFPVNAIVGGVMAQEIVKAVSYKDTPHNNFFFYDGFLTSGLVQKISPDEVVTETPIEEQTIQDEKKPVEKKQVVEEIVL